MSPFRQLDNKKNHRLTNEFVWFGWKFKNETYSERRNSPPRRENCKSIFSRHFSAIFFTDYKFLLDHKNKSADTPEPPERHSRKKKYFYLKFQISPSKKIYFGPSCNMLEIKFFF